MSYPIDLKEEQQAVAMETGQETPSSEGEGEHPCRFFRKGGGGGRRRGGRCCNRRHQSSFIHGFALRFFIFSAVSLLYTHRAVLAFCFQPVTDFVSTPYSVVKTLADIPFQLHPFVGMLFYSALAAFVMTSLRMRLMQKRRARMQKWRSESRNGHEHKHHGRHTHCGHSHFTTEEVASHSQVEVEKAPLIVVD